MVWKIPDPVVVLCGGQGTRLKSVVSDRPKVLAPIGDRTFLDFLLSSLSEQGASRVILSLHYEAGQIIKHIERSKFPGLVIETCVEPRALGTGGGLRFVVDHFDLLGSLYVMNGDTFIPDALKTMSESIYSSVIGLVETPDAERYGSVEVSGDLVTDFSEKSGTGQGMIYSGVARLESLGLIGFHREEFSLERDYFPKLVAEERLHWQRIDSSFIDIGIPKDYATFKHQYSPSTLGQSPELH